MRALALAAGLVLLGLGVHGAPRGVVGPYQPERADPGVERESWEARWIRVQIPDAEDPVHWLGAQGVSAHELWFATRCEPAPREVDDYRPDFGTAAFRERFRGQQPPQLWVAPGAPPRYPPPCD